MPKYIAPIVKPKKKDAHFDSEGNYHPEEKTRVEHWRFMGSTGDIKQTCFCIKPLPDSYRIAELEDLVRSLTIRQCALAFMGVLQALALVLIVTH